MRRMNDVKNSRAMMAFSSLPKQCTNSDMAKVLMEVASSRVELGEHMSSISPLDGRNFAGVINIVLWLNVGDSNDDDVVE